MTVYHVSEEPGISLFEPREVHAGGDAFVWAIDDEHLRNPAPGSGVSILFEKEIR